MTEPEKRTGHEILFRPWIPGIGNKVFVPHLESAMFGLAEGLAAAALLTQNWWLGFLAAIVAGDLAAIVIGTRRQERAELLKMPPKAG